MLLYRDAVYHKRPKLKGIAEVMVARHRHGAVGAVHLAYLDQCARFENLAAQDENT